MQLFYDSLVHMIDPARVQGTCSAVDLSTVGANNNLQSTQKTGKPLTAPLPPKLEYLFFVNVINLQTFPCAHMYEHWVSFIGSQ